VANVNEQSETQAGEAGQASQAGQEFDVVLPPNARLSLMQFDLPGRTLRVSFADGGSDRTLRAEDIIALHGARIRHEMVKVTPRKLSQRVRSPEAVGSGPSSAVGKITGEIVQTAEQMHFALGLRATGVNQVWYLMADSFNFRKTLGPDATYATEINVRALVRKLAELATRATQDGFFTAVLGGVALPPAVNSLIEFLRVAGKDLP
jgi:hypothetical protein